MQNKKQKNCTFICKKYKIGLLKLGHSLNPQRNFLNLLKTNNKLEHGSPTMSQQLEINAYLKPQCGWSAGVRAIMEKYELEYTDFDIINNSDLYATMVEKSGQNLSPCVEVNNIMLADVSGEEVEEYLLKNNLVKPVDREAGVPTNSACSDEEHATMQTPAPKSQTIRFF
tara:strand:+ start:726 stop:1235 length:510 start_codon:yes stop_codon:yes gene_type:complete